MANSRWLTLSRKDGPALQLNSAIFRELLPDRQHACLYPSIITFIGRKEKSRLLREILGGANSDYPQEYHSQVHLWPAQRMAAGDPVLIADSELQSYEPSRWQCSALSTGPRAFHKIDWTSGGKISCKDIAAHIYSRILAPLSHVLVYFADDLDGVRGVALLLAEQVRANIAHEFSEATKPHILVVVPTISLSPKTSQVDTRLLTLLRTFLRSDETFTGSEDIDRIIYSCFRSIRILSLNQKATLSARSEVLRAQVAVLDRDARKSRISQGALFSCLHQQAFCKSMLDALCKPPPVAFSFISASRPHGFDCSALSFHLSNLLNILECEALLWQMVVPLLGSCLLLASYPPGSHLFPPALLYRSLYKTACVEAIYKYTPQMIAIDKFIKDVETEFCSRFDLLVREQLSAKSLHSDRLRQLHALLKSKTSNESCFCCMLRGAEKVLTCGHSYCNICIRSFGDRSNSDPQQYTMSSCIQCLGRQKPHVFRLKPSTAGIRILSLDGGGIRGIITLAVLRHVDQQLAYLDCPLQDHFDFVAGTSSGGIVAVGFSLMGWTPDECFDKFYAIAHETFGKFSNGSLLFHRMQSLLILCLQDSLYKSVAIKCAFRSAFGPPPKMFNPLSSDTKVAVLAAPVGGNATSVICNYNGLQRPEDIGYRIIRASQSENDVTIEEAVQCTSAAPGYFKPKFLKQFGTQQDGALHHNNPSKIAWWEQRFIWGYEDQKDRTDCLLSIGTGTKSERPRDKPPSPRKDRFYSRVIAAFSWNLDSQQAWKDMVNFVPEETKCRLHRLNLPLEENEPNIDDIAKIDFLASETKAFIDQNPDVQSAADNLLASAFYFELSSVVEELDGYSCTGEIYCRLNMSRSGRSNLYQEMINKSAYFLIGGRPIPCITSVPQKALRFRRRVEFTVEDLNERLFISLHGITTKPWQISGLPCSIGRIANNQGLFAEFGRSDHQQPQGKARLSRKRHYCSV